MEKASTPIYTRTCDFCKKENTFIDRDGYVNFDGYCNDECREGSIKAEKIDLIKTVIERNIPKRFIDLETDKSELFERHYGKSLFITGSSGTGKTVFACSVLKRRIREKPLLEKQSWETRGRDSALFRSYPKFIMNMQSAFRNDDQDPDKIMNNLAGYPGYLCIDDLGAEKLTDFVKQITYFLINEREQNMLPIIITSNFSLEQIDRMVDPRISSRISGMCEVLRFTGKDRRIK